MAIDLDYYLTQVRRIAEHREAGAEKEIRKLYKDMLKELQAFVADAYTKYAEDDKLTFAMLQKAGYDARFLSEIEKRINVTTPKAAKELRRLVNDTYTIAYDGMVDAVLKGGSLDEAFKDAVAITPNQVKKIVKNPIMDLALEKNHANILYDIKQVIAVGLMNGDRYTTMARRISETVDGDFYKSVRIARTEAHRVIEAGNHDAAVEVDKELQNGTSGLRMVKTWKTMKDERVRPQYMRKRKKGWSRGVSKSSANHMILEGQVVLENEEFDLMDGATAMAPGSSGKARHDINCRCRASRKMMTDEEYYAVTGKHFPGYKEEKDKTTGASKEDYKELSYEEYTEEAKKAKFNEGLYWDEAKETVLGDGPKYDFSSRETYERAHKIHEAQSALYGGYIGTTNSYHINEYLREHDVLGDSMLDHSIRAMDDIVGSWKSTKKMSVTRFVTDDYLTSTFGGDTLSDILQNIGTVITEKQFLSTSANEAINVFSEKRQCKLKMYVDEGTVCFPTLNYGESEIIFPRGTKYEIVGAEENDSMIDIIVKVLK